MGDANRLVLDRMKAIRRKFSLTQTEFAQRIGLTQTSLSMIEIGKSPLTEKNIKLICATFSVDERWLRTGEGEMFGVYSPYIRELLDIFEKLTEGTQEFLLEMAKKLLEKQEREGK
jgi:transcriptional regulator with XRE-family HTH domain